MIVLILHLGRGFHKDHARRRTESPGRVWNEVRDLVISHLEGTLADGPKKLKTIEVSVGLEFEPELVMEEVIV